MMADDQSIVSSCFLSIFFGVLCFSKRRGLEWCVIGAQNSILHLCASDSRACTLFDFVISN